MSCCYADSSHSACSNKGFPSIATICLWLWNSVTALKTSPFEMIFFTSVGTEHMSSASFSSSATSFPKCASILVTTFKPVNTQVINSLAILLVNKSLYEVKNGIYFFFNEPVSVFSLIGYTYRQNRLGMVWVCFSLPYFIARPQKEAKQQERLENVAWDMKLNLVLGQATAFFNFFHDLS